MKRLKGEEARRLAEITLKKHGYFRSLKEFRKIFLEEARKKHPEASISLQRLKSVLKEIENAKFRIRVRSAPVEEQHTCPVCGSELKKVYVKTLSGEKEFAGVRCGRCGFFAKKRKFKPARYEIYSLRK